MKLHKSLVILGLAAATTVTAHAQIINIAITENATGTPGITGDLMTGSAVLGSTPSNTTDFWNTLNVRDVQSFSDLKNTAGVGSGVSLAVTGFQGVNGSSSTNNFKPALFRNFGYEFVANGGQSTLDFSGLTANFHYTLVVYGLNGSDAADTSYTVNGVTTTLIEAGSGAFTSTLTTNANDPGLSYAGNYLSLTGLTDASGNLNITLNVAPSNLSNNGPDNQGFSYMAFAGLQLEAAPEPGTTFLTVAGLGGLVFFARGRRLFAFRR